MTMVALEDLQAARDEVDALREELEKSREVIRQKDDQIDQEQEEKKQMDLVRFRFLIISCRKWNNIKLEWPTWSLTTSSSGQTSKSLSKVLVLLTFLSGSK